MSSFLKNTGYILLLILAYVAVQGVFTFLSITVATIYAVAKGDIAVDAIMDDVDMDFLASSLTDNGIYVWSVAVGLFFSTVAMLLFLHLTKAYRIKSSVFRSISSGSLFLSTMLIFSSMFAFNIFVQWFQLEDNLSEQFDGLTRNGIGVITIALFAPLLEEVLFRGAVQGFLLHRYKPWVAILCASLAFGIVHWNPVQTVYAILIGAVLGWIYYRTGSLLSVVVGHVLNNSIATVVLLMFGSEELHALPDGAVSPSAETASEIFTFLFFASLAVYFATRLHRSLPPVPSPWQDKGGTIR